VQELIYTINKIIGDHQFGFRHNRSTTDRIFYIRQILEKKWEYNETVHQLFVDFSFTYFQVEKPFLYEGKEKEIDLALQRGEPTGHEN
jgi:hypothetical protein